MSYGDYWETYPIEKGDIWTLGESRISVCDITEYFPRYMLDADMIYCDPPWDLSKVNFFNIKSGRECMNKFDEFFIPLFTHIEKIGAKVCYLETGNKNLRLFVEQLSRIYPIVQVWDILYYKKNPCHLVRGGYSVSEYDFSGMDDEVTPWKTIEYENPYKVADFCTGRGLTALAALMNGKVFLGTELNKRKLAILIHKSKKIGNGFQKEL